MVFCGCVNYASAVSLLPLFSLPLSLLSPSLPSLFPSLSRFRMRSWCQKQPSLTLSRLGPKIPPSVAFSAFYYFPRLGLSRKSWRGTSNYVITNYIVRNYLAEAGPEIWRPPEGSAASKTRLNSGGLRGPIQR